MKFFILGSLFVAAVAASLEQDAFQAFKLKQNKTYKTPVEETTRYGIFQAKLLEIEEHNSRFEQGLETYKKGVNKFSDWTQDEFNAYLGLHPKPAKLGKGIPYVKTGVSVPASVDWRTEGYVTGVKNQGDCGSCWAFSLTGSVEGALFKSTGKLVSLSEQQLVDCTYGTVNFGCDGGYLEETFPYIQETGLEAEASYPYKARDGTCKFDASKVVTKINDYVYWYGDEEALLEATATIGPISVAMDANYIDSYASGVFSSRLCSSDDLNHGVLVVGYGSENGVNYWLVKNSWAEDWGESGYLKLLRGQNECGIAEDDSYPIV
ncbi:hypothetical protein HUJ04_011681 [Dendroctonus ponderosae]|uniref:Peptidase C1A papain C-terminal domain-containing protein n=1 Tax=Dendroctonus ponderosae TaxID=77166 RepID=J3JXB3_DENPD